VNIVYSVWSEIPDSVVVHILAFKRQDTVGSLSGHSQSRTGHSHVEELIRACVADVRAFVASTELSDDRTLMALRRV
jgi:hypothetical protein